MSLSDWVTLLTNGGSDHDEHAGVPEPKKKKRKTATMQKKAAKIGTITFSCIQVCRNYIRSYEDSWETLGKQGFLQNLYTSGVGFYVFEGCSVIDMVFALRVQENDQNDQPTYYYLPLFVSVKSRKKVDPSYAKTECLKMEEKAKTAKCKVGALCLLVAIGAAAKSNDGEYTLQSTSCVHDLLEKKIVARVLRIPVEDSFGITAALQDMTSPATERSEVFASHNFIGGHCEDGGLGNNFGYDILRSRQVANRDPAKRKGDAVVAEVQSLSTELRKIAAGEKSGRRFVGPDAVAAEASGGTSSSTRKAGRRHGRSNGRH